ncbi:MAG: DUF5620 domain-containing protein [Oscillospiraceae bacterium]|nr:DUF5620 domain-containing protein [Oscillospiraceae bacterium]
MFSKTMTNRMKAAAVAALMCLSAATVILPNMTASMPVEAVSIGETLAVKDEYRIVTADVGTNLKSFTLTLTADYTGNFSYGLGISLAEDPWWMEWDGSGWVDTKGGTVEVPGISVPVTAGETFNIVIDCSTLNLKYDPAGAEWGAGEIAFRNYYSGEGGSVTLVSATSGSTGTITPTTPTGTTTPTDPVGPGPNTDGSTSQNKKSGTWTFKDNLDGTGTMTSTQARKIDGVAQLLTAGYDEETYAAEGTTPGPDDPINSKKFSYSTDFGLEAGMIGPKSVEEAEDETRDNIFIESLQATITSDGTPLKRFMYGGGMSVLNESPADTESPKRLAGMEGKETAGYWYNDMGEEKLQEALDAGAVFGIDPGMGYDLTSADGAQLGEWFQVVWDVPEAVYPYAIGPEISFQYWYGEEDVEEYTACEAVTLDSAVLTYTERKTFDYTDHVALDVNEEIDIEGMSSGVKFADLGLGANSSVKAIVFTVETGNDMDSLVYGIGASVGEDWKMWADSEAGDGWNFVVTDVKAGEVEIAWIVPSSADINEEYGNVQFGYWYGGIDGDAINSVTLKSVDVYYYEEEEATTEPTTAPTTAPTTEPTTEPLVANYGDVNVDGNVSIVDVIFLNKHLMGNQKLTEQGELNADVDINGEVESGDSLNILKSLVDLCTLPVGQ